MLTALAILILIFPRHHLVIGVDAEARLGVFQDVLSHKVVVLTTGALYRVRSYLLACLCFVPLLDFIG